ncbi:OmpA family protein [Flavobacterium sp. UBA4197]|uniref:OmpA family protein n=1 Tax=Flavobacterium sp. UBA4197 TaxID=1946546 RepID=UPI00257F5DBC|nr:OmpA family protein [Flavobacterium sp. UBA4197]
MKNLYITLSLVIAGATMNAQNSATAKADKQFNRFEYVSAAAEYLKLVDKGKADAYVYKQLGDAYYNVFNTAESAKWYAKAISEKKQDAETYFRYAQMLKANGKYDEANKQMQQFAGMAPNDLRAKALKENPDYLPKLLNKQKMYTVKSLDINSDKSDFGAFLSENSFYFTSARNTARKTYKWNDEPFLDIYRASYNADGTITDAVALDEINSKYHDGPVTITGDGNTMYFASESFKENSFEKDKAKKLKMGQVNLFKATKDGNKWGNVTALPFNSNQYSTSNPSISKDGTTLYFSSNMPGSVGGIDIWKVAVNKDGSYGTPENLGKKVNTEGDESFPFITEDNAVLYFVSNGRSGLGGLDVFMINLNKGTEAVNLAKPINSEKDDFAFTFNQSKNIGFFSSNRTGEDNIYQATPNCDVAVIAVVSDARTGAILSGAKVAILDEKKNIIGNEVTAANGEVAYHVECDKVYTLQVAKDGFESNTFVVTKQKGGEQKIDAKLNPIDVIVTEKEIVLKDINFEFNKSNITQEGAFELDKLVQVMQNNTQMVIMVKSHTDNRGNDHYNMRLSDRRAKATVQYVISKGIAANRISGKGYGESEPKTDCKENCTEAEHAANRRSEFLIIKK